MLYKVCEIKLLCKCVSLYVHVMCEIFEGVTTKLLHQATLELLLYML